MPARLILNADDFGLTPGVNRAIGELHEAGALTSATLMASGPAFAHAAELARQHPTLGVGCHIVLTDGTPVSPPASVPSLIGKDGENFRPSLNEFLLDAFRGRLRAADIYREALAQIQTLQRAGLRVTHIDTHKHTHIGPAIARPLLQAAEDAGVFAIRNPFEQPWSMRIGNPPLLRLASVALTGAFRRQFLALPQIRSGRTHTTAGTVGISGTGGLDEPMLRRILDALPAEGTWELVTHPGYNDADLDRIPTRLRETRDIERLALLHVFANELSSQPTRPELIHYGSL